MLPITNKTMRKNFALDTPAYSTGVEVDSSTDKHNVGFSGQQKLDVNAAGSLTQQWFDSILSLTQYWL